MLTTLYQTVRRDFIIPTNLQRREMVGNVILYFSVLASAFRLKSPLPPYLPPAEQARRRLVSGYISHIAILTLPLGMIGGRYQTIRRG